VYNNYENKKHLLNSAKDKKERFLYTLYHTRVSFCFLYVGIVMGLLFYVFDEKFMFYDLSIHFIAIGFIGITIASYLPMMLAPILGKPIAVNRLYKLPLILIIISLLTRTVGVAYISYFNGNGFTLLHALTSTSGFLILLAIVIFVALMYKLIKSNVWTRLLQQSLYALVVSNAYTLSMVTMGFEKNQDSASLIFVFALSSVSELGFPLAINRW